MSESTLRSVGDSSALFEGSNRWLPASAVSDLTKVPAEIDGEEEDDAGGETGEFGGKELIASALLIS